MTFHNLIAGLEANGYTKHGAYGRSYYKQQARPAQPEIVDGYTFEPRYGDNGWSCQINSGAPKENGFLPTCCVTQIHDDTVEVGELERRLLAGLEAMTNPVSKDADSLYDCTKSEFLRKLSTTAPSDVRDDLEIAANMAEGHAALANSEAEKQACRNIASLIRNLLLFRASRKKKYPKYPPVIHEHACQLFTNPEKGECDCFLSKNAQEEEQSLSMHEAILQIPHQSTRECGDFACPRCDLESMLKRYDYTGFGDRLVNLSGGVRQADDHHRRIATLARAEPDLPVESVVFQASLPNRVIGPVPPTNDLSRLVDAFVKPGIKLQKKKGVPYFYADPQTPGLVIREVDGRFDKGKFDKKGRFRPQKRKP